MMTQLEEMRALLTPGKVMDRNNVFEFVNAYTNSEYYYSKCFPILFPFGRGCPSDKNSKLNDIKSHSKKMLKRGGGPDGRRFQQSPNYYFTVYSYIMKQKIGGIASLAQRHDHDGTSLPTVGEINELMDFFSNNPRYDESERIETDKQGDVSYDMVRIKKLISRLVPYSRHAQGTEMGIRFEKRNLMALIPSPVINKEGFWRWFITFAPADLYDHRLYEILMKRDNESLTWNEKKLMVRMSVIY